MAKASLNKSFRKKYQRANQAKGVLLALGCIVLLWSGHYLSAILTLILAYIAHEVLWSDHIFYDPRQDYNYNFAAISEQQLFLQGNVTTIIENPDISATYILKCHISAKLSGYLYDPYLEVTSGSQPDVTSTRHYFERKLSGLRYLDISQLITTSTTTLTIKAHHCTIARQLSLFSFANPDLADKKVLIIAPHADDAELAAFGLYSQQRSFIATLTAGEVGAQHYEPLTGSQVAAAQLKGRLRAWDGVMISQWGGVRSDESVQLGYFCMTLEQMYQQQGTAVSSRTAALSDIRFFRTFNAIKLPSDQSGLATWDNLLADISEIIRGFAPDIIVTPHPCVDPHSDHRYATLACTQACEQAGYGGNFLLYANHYRHSDMFPFGKAGSVATLAPQFTNSAAVKPFSLTLTPQQQQDKLVAIAMMHDLQTPIGWRKKLRQHLQHILLGRDISIYGDDDYLRKAVRQNELFYQVDREQLTQLLQDEITD